MADWKVNKGERPHNLDTVEAIMRDGTHLNLDGDSFNAIFLEGRGDDIVFWRLAEEPPPIKGDYSSSVTVNIATDNSKAMLSINGNMAAIHFNDKCVGFLDSSWKSLVKTAMGVVEDV